MLGSRGFFHVRRLTAHLVLASLTAVSGPAMAAGEPATAAGEDASDERRMQAQSLYDQGLKLETSDPKAALGAFRSSYEIQANFRVLYNIARACSKLGDSACATRSYEQYLKDGGNEIPAKRRKEVEAELKALSAKATATITIKSSISGAFVKIDGSVVGRTPLSQPVPVRAGDHKVVLVADGNVIEKSVHVAAGSSETVELETRKEEEEPAAAAPAVAPTPAPTPAATTPAPTPAPAPAAATSETEERAPAPPAETKRHFPVVPWVVAGTFATATLVSGILTAGAASDYDAVKNQYPIQRDTLDAAHEKGRDLLMLTSVLGAVTVVSVGVAGYFTFFRKPSAPPNKTVGVKTVGVAIGPSGISITGRMP
jgi:hypothetical protein